MTITNKKSNPATYNKATHYGATENVSFPGTGRSDGGDRPGMVRQEGNTYLLRLRGNPHVAQWVIFKSRKDGEDGES